MRNFMAFAVDVLLDGTLGQSARSKATLLQW